MGGETEAEVSGWTVDTLKAYVERRLNEKDLRDEQRYLAHEQVHQAEHKTVEAAFEAAKEKSAAHNDLIRAGERAATTFLPRPEYETAHKALEDKLDALTVRVASNEAGLRGSRESTVRLFAALAALGTIAAIVFAIIGVVR